MPNGFASQAQAKLLLQRGDVAGAEDVGAPISDWLRFMKLDPGGPKLDVAERPFAPDHSRRSAALH